MTINESYKAKMREEVLNQRFYARIDFKADFTDPVYFPSHTDMSSIFTTEDVVDSTLINAPILSQELKSIPSIGGMSLKFNDYGGAVSAKLREKLLAGKDLNLKRIQVFSGFAGFSLGEYIVSATSATGVASYFQGVYTLSGKDVSIFAKESNIFIQAETILLASIIADKRGNDISINSADNSFNSISTDLSGFKIGAKFKSTNTVSNNAFYTVSTITQTKITTVENVSTSEVAGQRVRLSQATIECLDESGFEMLKHGTSFSDAPNQEVGYIKIGDNKIRYESNPTGLFQNCTQGVLRSKQAESIVDATAATENKTKIKEHKYFEMPFMELLYGILLSPIYSQSGFSFASNDTLAIDAVYIRASDFTGIGSDLWNTSDANIAKVCFFDGLEKTNAKSFIEKEILPPLGCSMKVYPNGEWGIERNVLPTENGSPSFILDNTNSSKWGALKYDATKKVNKIKINWGWSDLLSKFQKSNTYIVGNIEVGIEVREYEVNFKGIDNRRHTNTIIAAIADSIAEQVAYPPLTTTCEVLPYMSLEIENGKIGHCSVPHVKDFSGSGDYFNRAMKVVKYDKDLYNGIYKLTFKGTTGRAGGLIETTNATVLPAGLYSTLGATNINIATLASYYTVGNVGHIGGNETFVGGALVTDVNFYHIGDLIFDPATEQTFKNNYLLSVAGFCTGDGATFNGEGFGLAGGVGSSLKQFPNNFPPSGYWQANQGAQGGVGTTISAGGLYAYKIRDKFLFKTVKYTSTDGEKSYGTNFADGLKNINLEMKGGVLKGLEGLDLRGIGAPSGGAKITPVEDDFVVYADGGDGGNGGAAFVLISQGSSFINSKIITDGATGGFGIDETIEGKVIRTGAGGGGHAGAIAIFNDGVGASPASLTGVNVQNIGATQLTGAKLSRNVQYEGVPVSRLAPNNKPFFADNEFVAGRDVSKEFSVVKYIREEGSAGQEPNENVPREASSLVLTPVSTDVMGDGTVVTLLKCAWDQSTDPLVDGYELKFTEKVLGAKEQSYNGALNRDNNSAFIPYLITGKTYSISLYSINIYGKKSEPLTEDILITGNTNAPATPSTPATIISWPSAIEFKIEAANVPQDSDLHGINIYSSTTNDIATATDIYPVGIKSGKDFNYTYAVTAGETRYHWWDYFNRSLKASGTYPSNTSGQAQAAGFATGQDVKYSSGVKLDDREPIEAGATNAGSAIESLTAGMLPNWNLNVLDKNEKPAGLTEVVYTGGGGQISFGDSTNSFIKIVTGIIPISGFGFPAIPVDDKQKYKITIRHKALVAAPSGIFLTAYEKDTQLKSGATHVGEFNSTKVHAYTTALNIIDNSAITTSWAETTVTYTPTAGTEFMTFAYSWTNLTSDYFVEFVQMSIIAKDADQIAETGGRKFAAESGADVTKSAVESVLSISDLGAIRNAAWAATKKISIDFANQQIAIGDDNWASTNPHILSQWNGGYPRFKLLAGPDKFFSVETDTNSDGTGESVVKLGRDVQLLGANAYNNSNIYYQTHFDSIDNSLISIGGSGSGVLMSGYLRASVGTSSGDYIEVSRHITTFNAQNYNNQNSFKARVVLFGDAVTSLRKINIGCGDLSNGFGFTNSGDFLAGYALDGTGTTTEVVFSKNINFTGEVSLEAILLSGTIKFYVDGAYQSGKDIITNIPSGVKEIPAYFIKIANNSTNAALFRLGVGEWKYLHNSN